MPIVNEPTFDAPIPGMSLTHELGGRPWQQPAQFSTVDEAIEYYMVRMTSEEFMDQLIDVMEMGVPVTTLANTVQLSGVMEGKHTVDVGMLITPLLMELMMMLAESAEIEYVSGLEDPDKKKTRNTLLTKYALKYEKELRNVDTKAMAEENDMEEVEASKEKTMPTGLMSRR
jgi:hypothetical protein